MYFFVHKKKRAIMSGLHIENIREKDGSLRFNICNTKLAVVNGLRRIILSDIPTLALDAFIIEKNNTVFDDAYLTHRMSLIPVKSEEAQNLVTSKECECLKNEHCERCSVEFHLDVQNDKCERLNVTSHDFTCSHPTVQFVPMNPPIPLVTLALGHHLKLTALAKKGTTRQHAKWNPVSLCFFKPIPHIVVNTEKKISCEDLEDVIKNWCPKKIFKWQNNNLVATNTIRCDYCQECVRRSQDLIKRDDKKTQDKQDKQEGEKEKPLISVTPSTCDYYFEIEGHGMLSNKDIMLQALHVLKQQLTELENCS